MPDPEKPTLEMLWEPHDPRTVLETRFGFRDAGSAGRWVAAILREHWGVHVDSNEHLVMSDRNAMVWATTPIGQLLAKWSVTPERFTRLAQIARLTRWLHGQGLPVSAPIPSLAGEPQVEVDQISMSLQHVIRGDLLDDDNSQQVQAAGETLAQIHQALRRYPHADLIAASQVRPTSLATRVADWTGSAHQHAPGSALAIVERLLADAPTESLPTQLVHGDFRSANILCAGSKVAAVIDFEELRLDHCVDEVARSAVMLGTRFRDWGPVSAEVHATFLSGYQAVRQLSPTEKAWWDILVLGYTLVFVPPGEDPTGWGRSAISQAARLNI